MFLSMVADKSAKLAKISESITDMYRCLCGRTIATKRLYATQSAVTGKNVAPFIDHNT